MKAIAEQKLEQLEKPSLRYGLGIWINLEAFDFEKVINGRIEETSLIIDKKELCKKETTPKREITEKLEALHFATCNDYVTITIPKGKKENITITSKELDIKAEHIQIIAEEESEANICIKQESSGYYYSQHIEVTVKDNAKVHITTIQNNKETYNFNKHKSHVQRNGQIAWTDIILGSTFSQIHTENNLEEEGAIANKKTIFFSNNTQQFDINDVTIHKASNTISETKSRGAVDNKSKTIYRGTVKVEKDASNCIGKQKAENLLLSKTAQCDAVPILEINNDNVQCAHGASFSQINKEELFYLQTRGIKEEKARETIIQGFLGSLVKDVEIKEEITKKLGVKNGR